MSDVKCRKCESSNTIYISSVYSPARTFSETHGNYGVSRTISGSVSLYINKYACLDCEQISEYIDQSSLKEYKEKMPYFK